MEPLPGEVGVHGTGPNAIHWCKPSYLRRVEEAFNEAYEKHKEEMGDRPFFIGRDPVTAYLERLRMREEEEARAEAAAASDIADSISDIYSLRRLQGKKRQQGGTARRRDP